MSENERDPFAGVEALLAQAAGSDLPPPAERARLRKAAGLTQAQIAKELGLKRRETVAEWENGEREPRPPRRTAYLQLLQALAARFPAPAAPAGAETFTGAEPADAAASSSTPTAPSSASSPSSTTSQPPSTSRRPAKKAAAKKPSAKSGSTAAAPDLYPDGPLAVLDGDGTCYGVGGQMWECPATSVVELMEWTLAEMRLGAQRLNKNGMDADPLIVLTEGAVARLGLPAQVEAVPSADGGRRLRRLPDQHPVLAQLADAAWQLTRRGFGPWARIYRPVQDGRRQCVQLAVLPWGALDLRAWGSAATLPAPELVRALGAYATRVLTPRGSTAVNGLELMTALRPPTRAVWDPEEWDPDKGEKGKYVPGPVPGSLTQAVTPPLPEAPIAHPLAAEAGLDSRLPEHMVDEEAYDWIRDPETLTDAECALPHAVGLDVNAAFLAAANRLTVGLGEPEHHAGPRFDKRIPGCWLVDLSHVEVDERLPSPFTPDGTHPTGPAWYETPTVAYAEELGYQTRPIEGWLYREAGGYLDPWYQRLSAAYLQTMAALGVTRTMAPEVFLAAMDHHKDADPPEAATLSAIKSTVKGGIGKLAEGPAGRTWRRGQPWAALERPTWRPHIRYTLISTARMWMHRRMRNMAAHDLYPLGVLSDCVVYPSPGPTPLDLLPTTGGAPAKGVFPLGPAPGQVKHEGTQPFLWAAELLDGGGNPARHIKGDGHDAVAEGK